MSVFAFSESSLSIPQLRSSFLDVSLLQWSDSTSLASSASSVNRGRPLFAPALCIGGGDEPVEEEASLKSIAVGSEEGVDNVAAISAGGL